MEVAMACTDKAEALARLSRDPWFAGLPQAFQAALLEQAAWQRLEPHHGLTHGGDTSGGMVGLAEGVALVYPAVGPAEAGPIHLVTGPVWFGQLPLSRGRPRAVSVITQSACLVARVSRQRMLQLLSQNPGWWEHMHDLAITHFLTAAQTAADLHIHDSRRRLCAALLRLGACRHEGGCDIDLPISQHDLATIANMSRQTVGHLLKGLAKEGLLHWGYRKIRLKDPDELRRIADE